VAFVAVAIAIASTDAEQRQQRPSCYNLCINSKSLNASIEVQLATWLQVCG